MILFEALKAFKDKTPFGFLALSMIAMSFCFTGWAILSTNFAVNVANMDGSEWGWTHTIREIPGLLAFTTIYLLLLIAEQRLAVFSILLLSLGIAITGYFPTPTGFLLTTFIMSIGFHYYYTLYLSLPMQMFGVNDYPIMRAKLKSIEAAFAALAFILIFAAIYLFEFDYTILFMVSGIPAFAIGLYLLKAYQPFKLKHPQTMTLLLRRRYWLYYVLQFLSGSRRQIFTVFASLLLVDKFGFTILQVAALFFLNHLLTTFVVPYIGRFVLRYGERFTLQIEYIGLFFVFALYGLVETAWLAAMLYIIDNIFFSLAISLESYFKRIADKAEIAASAAIIFSINHIGAVILPFTLGLVWLHSPSIVFYIGAGLAAGSFIAACVIPRFPKEGNEIQKFSLSIKPIREG